MAEYSHVLVRTSEPSRVVAREVAGILGVELHPQHYEERMYYCGSTAHVYVTVGEHDLVDDCGIPFEAYPRCIDFRARHIRTPDPEDYGRWRIECARCIFDGLAATGRYGLLLVDGVQVLVDRYEPHFGG